ncbi:hypothetical protein [Hyunsoonleella ulvae]|uniref:hypothetical protein n=1 Tax=Hyunsoonleella ulvae TaxID=2799948 RepID=UPI00193A0005|nr:hypothetical protein [Hyunsoonleella ulvae]
MNYNIATYCLYIPIIFFIMIYVGWLFYKHGELFLLNLFRDTSLVKSINNLLLIGYYLVNLGYAIITIAYWENIHSIQEMLNTLSYHLGIIILGLAILHYNNVFWLTYLVKYKSIKQ